MTKPQLMPWIGGSVEFKADFTPLICPIDESVASQLCAPEPGHASDHGMARQGIH